MHNIFVVLSCISSTVLINFSYIYLALIVLHCSSFSSNAVLISIELLVYSLLSCMSCTHILDVSHLLGALLTVLSPSFWLAFSLSLWYSLNFQLKIFSYEKRETPIYSLQNRINNVYSSKIYENKGTKAEGRVKEELFCKGL